jgi:hypothetical protein
VIARLALRNLVLRPWRSVFLLLGYSVGVAVMIVLLSIGEALVSQARNEKLIGGGNVTVLPQGIDVEVLKTGGLGGLFFSIDHASFLYRQLLAAPRLKPEIAAAAPQIAGKLLYLTLPNGTQRAVLASGDIPSLTRAVGAAPALASGAWTDDSLDAAWRSPTAFQLRNQIDHFHLPPDSVRGNPTWAEWHYFNVLTPDQKRWIFVSFIVGGAVPSGQWGGQVLITTHDQAAPGSPAVVHRFVASVPKSAVRFSTNRADVVIGTSRVQLLTDGRYAITARAPEADGLGQQVATVNLVVTPAPGAYFPGAALGAGDMVSGYVVPALRADASGSVCVGNGCQSLVGVQAYHDHNWGVWKGVTWEWGAARAGAYTLLYGRVQPSDSAVGGEPLFAYLVDSLGYLAVFRPSEIRYRDDDSTIVAGRVVHTPSSAMLVDVRGDDTLRVELTIDDAAVSDTRGSGAERGNGLSSRALAHPYFVQMKGRATLGGRVAGRPISGKGAGFFETYR